MNTELMVKTFEGKEIFFMEDGYINATKVAKFYHEKPDNWLVREHTKKVICSISRKLDIQTNQLVVVRRGAPETGGGTWIHPKLAVHFAYWLDVDFGIWVGEQIERILHNYQISNARPEFPTQLHPVLQFPVIGRQEDLLMKGTRNTYTAILDFLGFPVAIYKQVLTNNVSRILIGMSVKPFRRLHGIPAGSRRRTRLYYDSNLRRAMNEIEEIACMRLRESYLDERDCLVKPVTFEEIEKLVYEVAGTIRDYTRLRSVNLLEHIPEQEFEM